jgi:hypothetical protein
MSIETIIFIHMSHPSVKTLERCINGLLGGGVAADQRDFHPVFSVNKDHFIIDAGSKVLSSDLGAWHGGYRGAWYCLYG